MKAVRLSLISTLCLTLLAGCHSSGVRGFWKDVPLLEENLSVSENRFADFAELAVKAPEQESIQELDALFDRLKDDEVAYYIYSEWMDAAFYNPYSPCRSAALYTKAVERLVSDGVLSMDDCEPYLQHRDWININLKGNKAIVPGVSLDGKRTLILVLDLGCPSCREALNKLASDKEWKTARKVAIGMGHGPEPDTAGWEYFHPEDSWAVFDIKVTPVYFVVSEDGTVETPYTPAL
jgi:hypothetical protein